MLSYLPLAHSFGRILEELALCVGGHIGYWQARTGYWGGTVPGTRVGGRWMGGDATWEARPSGRHLQLPAACLRMWGNDKLLPGDLTKNTHCTNSKALLLCAGLACRAT